MTNLDLRLLDLIKNAIGPVPWYWETFPAIRSATGQRLVWSHQGKEGSLPYVITLSLEMEPERPLLALNTYCRPFHVPPNRLGIWCPEARNLRFACFDPDQLEPFDLSEIAGWFKQSTERIYAATAPLADFEISANLAPGTHTIEVPQELAGVEELIVPTNYKAMSNNDPAYALFVLYPHAGLVQVLPQKWFTTAQYDLGYEWITRAARDPETFRIVGDGIRIGTFLLQEDGCCLERWIETVS